MCILYYHFSSRTETLASKSNEQKTPRDICVCACVCDSHQVLAVALTSSAELQSGAERMRVKAYMQKLCLHLDCGPSLGGGVNYVAPLIDHFSARAQFFLFFKCTKRVLNGMHAHNCICPGSLGPGQNVIKSFENLLTKIIFSLSSQPVCKVSYYWPLSW